MLLSSIPSVVYHLAVQDAAERIDDCFDGIPEMQ